MVEKNTNDVEIKISLTGNDTICRVKLENSLIEDIQKKQGKKVVGVDNIETIIILDRSGSMGDQVQRLYNIIIPGVLYNLGYTADSVVNIVTFDSAIQVLNTKVSKMAAEKIYCRGSTYMAGTIKEIEKLVLGSKKAYFRILAISDGEISDQPATLELASKLADVIKHQYIISAQAVRFFTSSSQPSTKGLSSILQFNTISEANLVDIPQNLENDEIIFQLALLFQDNLGKIDISIKSSNEIFKINPWNVAKKSLNLKSGENIFWLAKQADINGVFNFSYLQNLQLNLAINGSDYPHKIVFENNTNNKLDEFYSELFKDKIDYYFNQIKILKVINNSSSAEEINKIMQYFKGIDDLINATSSESQDLISLNKKLGSRIEYFKQVIKKREKSVYSRLNEIANDDKVSQLNSAQQADYLRNVEVTKNSKSLAKRAINEGINFTDLVRDEVKNMHKHFSEVSSIKDDNHFVSFYSTCTTLDGVKALVETVENGMIDSMDVNDVLKLVNIVGIACDGPIGEYPDPMVWRVSNIFSGTQVSLSDVLVAFESSGGKDLVDIGTKQKITNVVPFFEDEKLMKFFLKYAPNILQYTASVGMRRIIANVPLTFEYTLSSGIWKMVEEVHNSKSDIAIRQLCCMVRSYEIVISNYFAHVMDHFKEQDPKISYFIGNNGITNMISPLIFSIKNDKKGEKFKYYDRILRALYSFEAYQQVRKELKGENYEQNVTKRLNDFLGVDFTKYSTALPELFETIENPVFHDSYTISIEDLNKYKKKLWFLNYALLLPEY